MDPTRIRVSWISAETHSPDTLFESSDAEEAPYTTRGGFFISDQQTAIAAPIRHRHKPPILPDIGGRSRQRPGRFV
jgi:hypothetical protein